MFEWGAILTYFYCSHRIAAFLRPDFRPMVLATGILLLLTGVCVLLFPEQEAFDERDCDDPSCGRSHARLTAGGALGFLVLLFPIAFAADISPDTFGRTLIENRGAAETLDNTPAAASLPAAPVYVGVDQPGSGSPAAPMPANAFQYSASVSLPDSPQEYPSFGRRTPVPLNERPGAVTSFGTLADVLELSSSPMNQDGVLPTQGGGVHPAEVVDLLIAAQKPELRKALGGRTVEMVGQCLRGGKGSFRLLRLLMVCCAADAQPLAVRVKSRETPPDMAWAKIVGRVSFEARGGRFIPLVTAEKVTRTSQPDEPYIY